MHLFGPLGAHSFLRHPTCYYLGGDHLGGDHLGGYYNGHVWSSVLNGHPCKYRPLYKS